MLEPDEVKISRPVLRGLGAGNSPRLLDLNRVGARENIGRRLFYPVIDFKIRNSFKFLYVIGDQDAAR